MSELSQAKVFCCSFNVNLRVVFSAFVVVREATETAFDDAMEGP